MKLSVNQDGMALPLLSTRLCGRTAFEHALSSKSITLSILGTRLQEGCLHAYLQPKRIIYKPYYLWLYSICRAYSILFAVQLYL